jgi:hypothetical protein
MTSEPFSYISNSCATIRGPRNYTLRTEGVERAVHRTRVLVNKLSKFEVDVFSLLGMRNLSAFVGEVFAATMILEHPDLFKKNPHQDGYPDLLLLDDAGMKEWYRTANRLREKAPFSPFETGGFEVKATCGSVPTPAHCQKHGVEKPDMGDQRLSLLTDYDWKAHHQETNHLFGLFWDFIGGCPTIAAVFYRGDLDKQDWGTIVQPKEGGGRTTSVSIMTRAGVKKMYEGWITVIDDEGYAKFFDARNGGRMMSDARSLHRERRTAEN